MGTVSTLRYPSALMRFAIQSAVLRNVASRSVAVAVAGGLFVFGLVFAWLAFTIPVEIELREGSVWIHVLAKRAGVDIYDPAQVAFVNMNHGPLDAIFKTWLSTALPALPGHMVTRFFVLLTPFALLWAAYVVSRRSLTGALMAAGALFLLWVDISRMALVGRNDATAVCAVAVCGVLTHQLLVYRSQNWSSRSYILRQIGLGAVSGVVFLVSWRYFLVPAALQCVVLAKQIAEPRRALPRSASRSRRAFAWSEATLFCAGTSGFCFLFGFSTIWLATFLLELEGDGLSYYRHFFGFFSAESGWGLVPGSVFQILPRSLWTNRVGALLVFAGLILIGLYRLRKRPAELVAWLLMLVTLWVAVCYGYYKNEAAGGLHYFFEFFIFAWIFVIHAICQRRRGGAHAELALLALVVCLVSWRDLSTHYEKITDVRTRAIAFRNEVAIRTAGEAVFGEETHLFKDEYRGEVIDTGDTTEKIVQNGYFGRVFSQTYRQYLKDLGRNPPPFVLVGLLNESTGSGVMTPALRSLLRLRYTRVATMSNNCFAYGGSQALYELKNRTRARPEP